MDLNAKVYVPTHFAGLLIKYRIPRTMPGELIVAAGGANLPFPVATFQQTTELPFEIWEMNLQASQSVLGGANFIPIAEPAPTIDKFWRLRIRAENKNQDITKNAQLAATLKNTNRNVWDWKIPFTIIREEGFQVAIDNLLAANFLRAEISFIGYHLVLTPPSETR